MSDAGTIHRIPEDARVPPKPATPRTPDRPRRRKPLGLAPAGADAPTAEARPPASEDRFVDPAVNLVVEANELILDLVKDTQRHFERKIAGLENQIGGLKNENQALRLILENLRITQRGERGLDGDRGPPGRDGLPGAPGAIGPRGSAGPRGEPAPRLCGWTVDEVRFSITPLMGDGSSGPVLSLLGLFQSYDAATNEIEDRDIVSAAADSRARSEEEADAAAHWAR